MMFVVLLANLININGVISFRDLRTLIIVD